MNYNQMIIKNGEVFKLKRGQSGTPTDMANCTHHWHLPFYAKPLFQGTKSECLDFVESAGGEVSSYA